MSAIIDESLDVMEAPLVSVLVPCFNYARYVGEALRSILAQDYPNFELIVVDDGSTDESSQVIRRVLNEQRSNTSVRRVEFISQENQGVSAALNAALISARGEYIATFDADDLMPPGRLKLQIDYLQDQPLVGCVGGQAIRIDEEGCFLPKKEKKREVRRYDFSTALANALVVGGGMAVFRREAINLAGGYDPAIKIQDFQITLKVAGRGFLIDILPDVVTYYRKHEGSLSKNYKAEFRYGLMVIDEYKGCPEYDSAKKSLVARALRLAVIYDKKFAWQLFKQVPVTQWDKTIMRRMRHFIFKRSKPEPAETL